MVGCHWSNGRSAEFCGYRVVKNRQRGARAENSADFLRTGPDTSADGRPRCHVYVPVGALRADKRGIQAVGAPMGGGVEAAEAAELEFFVGGAQSARERVTPILEELARIDGVRVVGDDIGDGYAAKLLINLLWFGQVAAVSEALLLAERLGVSAGSMRQLIAGSAADGAFARRHLDRLLAGDDMATFGLRECVDELDILTALASVHRSPFEVSSVVARLHHEALERYGPVDGELMVARLLEERGGTVLRHAQTMKSP